MLDGILKPKHCWMFYRTVTSLVTSLAVRFTRNCFDSRVGAGVVSVAREIAGERAPWRLCNVDDAEVRTMRTSSSALRERAECFLRPPPPQRAKVSGCLVSVCPTVVMCLVIIRYWRRFSTFRSRISPWNLVQRTWRTFRLLYTPMNSSSPSATTVCQLWGNFMRVVGLRTRSTPKKVWRSGKWVDVRSKTTWLVCVLHS